jgi:hypothetical protein
LHFARLQEVLIWPLTPHREPQLHL